MWIEFPCVSKKGSDLGYHLINLNNILYFREWKENTPITEKEQGKTIGYAIGGKDIVIDMPLHIVYQTINEQLHDTKQQIRPDKMLAGAKADNKKKNQ